MSIGRKVLIGIGSFIGLTAVMAAVTPPQATNHGTTPSPSAAVLSSEAKASPAASPVVSATPTPQVATSTPVVATPTPATPQPTVAASSGSCSGGYINSAGNCVPSPTHADAPPADATAVCGDGTYSFSQSRSGTCSHHGGVARWL